MCVVLRIFSAARAATEGNPKSCKSNNKNNSNNNSNNKIKSALSRPSGTLSHKWERG